MSLSLVNHWDKQDTDVYHLSVIVTVFFQGVVEQQLSSFMEKGGFEEDFTTVDANLLLSVVQTMLITRPPSKSRLLLWLVVVVLALNMLVRNVLIIISCWGFLLLHQTAQNERPKSSRSQEDL